MENLRLLFFLPFLFGVVTTLLGFIFAKHPPKKINPWMGYRTPRSMASQEAWDFAQAYSFKKIREFGIMLLMMSFLFLLVPKMDEMLELGFGMTIGLISVILPVIYTERELKRRF